MRAIEDVEGWERVRKEVRYTFAASTVVAPVAEEYERANPFR
jgi:hypothetical protein